MTYGLEVGRGLVVVLGECLKGFVSRVCQELEQPGRAVGIGMPFGEVARRRLVGPALVGATPRASAVTAARRNAGRPSGEGGTNPAHLTCSYMDRLG